MFTPRRRVILRQIVRPPYLYRWVALLTTVALVVAVAVAVLADVGRPTVLATGPGPAVAASTDPASRPAVDVPTRGAAGPPRPAIVPSLLSVTQTTTDHPTVALTFDDGPTPGYTPQVLDLLAAHRIKATFCMIGEQAVVQRALVARVVAEGHRLCNHTFTHDATVGTHDTQLMDRQLRASRDAIASVLTPPAPVDYFRAPEGRWSPELDAMAAREGMRPLGWSVDTLDWTRPGVEAIVASVRRDLRPGAVVLFHDGGGPRDQTVEALRRLLPWLERQGYQFSLPT